MIMLAKDKRKSVAQGLLCPDSEVTLAFELSSDKLGAATQTLRVQVKSVKQDPVSTFEGYIIPDEVVETSNAVPEKLRLDKVQMKVDGRLIIVFTKPVLWPDFGLPATDESSRRVLG